MILILYDPDHVLNRQLQVKDQHGERPENVDLIISTQAT